VFLVFLLEPVLDLRNFSLMFPILSGCFLLSGLVLCSLAVDFLWLDVLLL
jgi:hypothetical protein